jgi:sugar phosphate isomerase/epimerase
MKIGFMNNPANSVYAETEWCGDKGFDFLDLTIEGPGAMDIDPDRLKPILDSYNLTVVGHTDPCLPYAYPIGDIRKACLKELERCAVIFQALGASVMNIHPCYLTPPAMRKDLVRFHIDALQPVVEMAASYDLTLVLENYKAPFDRVSTFDTLVKKVPGLKLHLDFGHTHFGKDSHALFCQRLGNHITHVHFSDNRSRSDDHMPLGVGSVNWESAVNSLKRIGYDNTITLEIFCGDPEMQYEYLNLSRKRIQALWDRS